MQYSIHLTDDATQDPEDLYDYIYEHDSPDSADYVLENIEKIFLSLSENPERGVYPKELVYLGIKEYREIFFKPYRIIYSINLSKVFVFLIVDGRRDIQAVLERRLLK